MELSKRLRTIADMVPLGCTLADIGTDHGYLPIALLSEDRIPSAIAMDINKGPLERAREHMEASGLTNRMTLRLSNGFQNMQPGEAECAVIAGMGGPLMIRILEEGEAVARSLKTMILSPQSDLESFRRWLLEHRYTLLEEQMIYDEEKYYVVMKVSPALDERSWTRAELRYGKQLISENSEVFRSFLDKEERKLTEIRETLSKADTEKAKERLSAVEEELMVLSGIRQGKA